MTIMASIKTTAQVEHLLKVIDNSVQKLQFSSSKKDDNNSLFYLGNWHESIPLFIYRDPILESIDRNVYGVIRSLTSKESATAFPTYDDICKYGNIASHATVSRAVAILRLVRWSTQRLVRCPLSGQIRRKVYIMHDQPLELADTLQLDPDYMCFLNDCLTHHHAYVRKVAKLVMKTIRQDLSTGKDPNEHEHHLNRQTESASYWIEPSSSYFGFSKKNINALKSPNIPTSIIEDSTASNISSSTIHPTSKIKESPTSKTEEHSSSFLINTTTNKTDENLETIKKEKITPPSFQFTPYLQNLFSSNEKHLVQMQLSMVENKYHQAIINQISNRIQYGENKVKRPISLLSWYCNEIKADRSPLTEYSLNDYHPESVTTKQQPKNTKTQIEVAMSNLIAEFNAIENFIKSSQQSQDKKMTQHWTDEKEKLIHKYQRLKKQQTAEIIS